MVNVSATDRPRTLTAQVTFADDRTPLVTIDGVVVRYDPGDIAYVLLCSSLVRLIEPRS